MRKARVTIEVDKNFEKGNCYSCPFSYELDWDDDGYIESETHCVLNCCVGEIEECPLVVYNE